MTIAREEIFGPVLATLTFDDVDEAIARANDSQYGLAAAVWTRDIKKAHYVASRLKAGTIWINTYNMYDAAMPFGGLQTKWLRPRSRKARPRQLYGDEGRVGGSAKMKKRYLLDTNVLLHDPTALTAFQDNSVLVPIYVIEEIDRFKKQLTGLGENARWISRFLDGLRQRGTSRTVWIWTPAVGCGSSSIPRPAAGDRALGRVGRQRDPQDRQADPGRRSEVSRSSS